MCRSEECGAAWVAAVCAQIDQFSGTIFGLIEAKGQANVKQAANSVIVMFRRVELKLDGDGLTHQKLQARDLNSVVYIGSVCYKHSGL